MSKEELIGKVLTATPEQLKAVEQAFTGNTGATETPTDRRLLTQTEAAAILGVSRMTTFRMIRDGRLPAVEIRNGRVRIPSQALTFFANGEG
jgi:excisionase family DNA binding protein